MTRAADPSSAAGTGGFPALDHLTIRGFKSIRELENFELKPLNVLIGANGAGKSNLVSFFLLLRALMQNRLERWIGAQGGISDLLFGGRKVTSEMYFETRFGERGYRFRLRPTVSEGFVLADEARYYEGAAEGRKDRGWWELSAGSATTPEIVREAENREPGPDWWFSRKVCEAVRRWTLYQFHDTSATAGARHAQIVEDSEFLRMDGSNVAPFLWRLRSRNRDAYLEILQACRLVAPWLDDFLLHEERFGPKTKVQLSWRARGSDFPMQPYHLSDGSLRFICLAAALLQPDAPSTVVLDEPELGLHPHALAVLGELLGSASTRTQIIVATQSPLLVDQFAAGDVVVVRNQRGESRFERLCESDYGEWLKEYRIGELWAKNVVDGGPVYD